MCLWHMWSAPYLCHHPTQTKKQQRKWPLPSIVGPPRNKKEKEKRKAHTEHTLGML
jgi:hypothetical protein